MQIVVFYENTEIFNKIKKVLKDNFLVYPLSEIYKLKHINADFVVVETTALNMEQLINKMESVSSVPYIIVTFNTGKTYQAVNLMEIIDYKDIGVLKDKIDFYLDKIQEDEYSIFELTNVMQMISMEKKTLGLRIVSKNKVGALIFKEGMPVYAKAIIEQKPHYGLEAAFKIITWEDLKFKVVKVIGNIPVNLNTDIPNLLMGAMQYKDELDYQNQVTQKENLKLIKKENGNLNCDEIINSLEKLAGYIGIGILKSGELICENYISEADINTQNIKSHLERITSLVTAMLNDMGFMSFDNVILTTDVMTAIIHHNEEKNAGIILFLKKTSNMALSKVILKKIMMEI